ncbi:uncharacterized protein N7498_002195 [Penicillium cinerascens]|uniref:Uncharacterized protein n=1 Tax=Penicillium cinerascens TaxID=70096 RepID=A0A9W9N9J0_9EURO|nr:uncharacterized protein N7498_002195 [Penicillium cinerascens]KAJ5215788.1 hypothetical protein N7498_002195 [Penicillium cinerascens]
MPQCRRELPTSETLYPPWKPLQGSGAWHATHIDFGSGARRGYSSIAEGHIYAIPRNRRREGA